MPWGVLYYPHMKITLRRELLSAGDQEECSTLKEIPLTQSAYTMPPVRLLGPEQIAKLCRQPINRLYEPYTVVETLERVFYRNFEDDLREVIKRYPRMIIEGNGDWDISRCAIHDLTVIRPESIFDQPKERFVVEICVSAVIELEEVYCWNRVMKKKHSQERELRLVYEFDMRPTELTCAFRGIVPDQTKSLLSLHPNAVRVDTYLMPILKNASDYDQLAQKVLRTYMTEIRTTSDRPFDIRLWLTRMRLIAETAVFDDPSVAGEYYFWYGKANRVNMRTNEVWESYVDPGTVLIDKRVATDRILRDKALGHEGSHHFLGYFFFMMQLMHGHNYSSYMSRKDQAGVFKTMEEQADRFPGHLMIRTETGKAHAERLLSSYGGNRSIENMSRLIEDMSEYYGTTKQITRERLLDVGYVEVRGVMRSANGMIVPGYLSDLGDNQTYTIDEEDGVREYVRNEAFRDLIDSGEFIYVEGHYCLKRAKFVYFDRDGSPHLTDFARNNMGECCLRFRLVPWGDTETVETNPFLQSRENVKDSIPRWARETDWYMAFSKRGKIERRQIDKETKDLAKIRMSMQDMLVCLMAEKRVDKGDLAEATGLSTDTIQAMRNDRNRVFELRHIYAVCIALQLEIDTTDAFVAVCPTKGCAQEEERYYRYFAHHHQSRRVGEINRLLVEMKVRPLTNLVDGFDMEGRRISNE